MSYEVIRDVSMTTASVAVSVVNNRRVLRSLAVALSVLVVAAVLMLRPIPASANNLPDPAKMTDRIVTRMQTNLNLTPDQVAAIRPIIQDSIQKRQVLRKQMMDLRAATDASITTVLTPDQQKEFQALKDKRHDRMRHRMHRDGAE